MNNIRLNRLGINSEKYAREILPVPTPRDYKNRYIYRYFARQRNNLHAPVVEIDKAQFVSHSKFSSGLNRSFYMVYRLRWVIYGKLEVVEMTNSKTVEYAESIIPGIQYKLTNMLQFWSKNST